MSNRLSTQHVCYSQHLNERKPVRCRCRKRVSLAEATGLVEKGFAQWIILSQSVVSVKEICPICQNTEVKKSCQHCHKSGEVDKTHVSRTYSTDIVLVTTGSENEKGEITYKPVLSQKTPRVATIERAHIERSYVDGIKEEQERIEAYGLMTLQSRIDMGIGVTPPDDDYGRSPFCRISDERTSLGLGKIGSRISKGFVHGDEQETGESIKEREE